MVFCSFRGTGFLSGHADGSIVRYYVADDASMDPQGKILMCQSPPYAIAWTLNHIVTAGCDKKVSFYETDGKLLRVIDYSKEDEKEFTVACCSPSGQTVAIGSFDRYYCICTKLFNTHLCFTLVFILIFLRIRLFSWNSAKSMWEENIKKEIKNLYTVTALNWKRDGSKMAVGSLCGGVLLFESVLK